MGRGVLVAVAIASLLLLAGCQSSTASGAAVTPVPVPTAADTGAVEGIPEAHREALDDRTYTTRVTYRLNYPNGTSGRLTERFTVGSGQSHLYERSRVGPYPGAPTNVTIWQDGATGFVRRAGANETDLIRSSTGTVLRDTTLSGFLGKLLGGFVFPIERTAGTRTATDSRTVVRTLPLPPSVHNARNVTAEVVVRDEVVRSVRIDARADRGAADEPVRVAIRFGVDGIGDPALDRPGWADGGGAGG